MTPSGMLLNIAESFPCSTVRLCVRSLHSFFQVYVGIEELAVGIVELRDHRIDGFGIAP